MAILINLISWNHVETNWTSLFIPPCFNWPFPFQSFLGLSYIPSSHLLSQTLQMPLSPFSRQDTHPLMSPDSSLLALLLSGDLFLDDGKHLARKHRLCISSYRTKPKTTDYWGDKIPQQFCEMTRPLEDGTETRLNWYPGLASLFLWFLSSCLIQHSVLLRRVSWCGLGGGMLLEQ